MSLPTPRFNLEVEPGQHWTFLVNGKVVAYGIGSTPILRDELEEQVRQSNAARAAAAQVRRAIEMLDKIPGMPDHTLPLRADKKRLEMFARGFVEGAQGLAWTCDLYSVLEPDACASSPGGPCHQAGYSLGEALRRSTAMALGRDPGPVTILQGEVYQSADDGKPVGMVLRRAGGPEVPAELANHPMRKAEVAS